jgi:hypothetical protein
LLQLVFFFIWSFNISGLAQTNRSLFEALYGMEEVKITLTYPFDSLYRTNQEEIDATISIESKAGSLMKDEPITINLRGKFRRMKCSMPPLLLNFKKSTLHTLQLNNSDEIKLVTHCLDTEEGQENLREERLCYQVYEVLTPFAYRTIWLTVEYHDTRRAGKQISSTGFLLEPDKDITGRLGIVERKLYSVAEDSLHFQSYSLAAAFNFMIGNRDWSIIQSRNAKLFYDSLAGKYIVIPYDFDYSNVIGASYRRETRPETMEHPLDRIYQGEYFMGRSAQILIDFQQYEDVIENRVMEAPNPMDEQARKKVVKYFETWFAQVTKTSPIDLRYGLVIPYKGGL